MPRKGKSSSARSVTSAERAKDELDEYEVMAKYYDIWYEDFTEDVDFYRTLAERSGGPVLECMCGTGRVMVPLADAGFEVTGVDQSSAMLDMLSSKIELIGGRVERNIEVIEADIRSFKTPTRFRFAFVPFNSFLHLLTRKEQVDALNNIAAHMEDDATLSVSVFNPRLDRPENLVRHRGTKVTSKGEIISKFEAQTFDIGRMNTTIHFFYDISRQDREFRRVTTSMTIKLMTYQEMADVLDHCGFAMEAVYGDYSFSPYRQTSELMAFVARKL